MIKITIEKTLEREEHLEHKHQSRCKFIKDLTSIIAGVMIGGAMLFSGTDAVASTPEYEAESNIVSKHSSWTAKRPKRASTYSVVYHQTEGSDRSSLQTVLRQGTCHYLITTSGKIYEIMPVESLAKHAGESRWAGKKDYSRYSVGVEIVGTHTKEPTQKQYSALKYLNAHLKKLYPGLKDKDFITHSMVSTTVKKGKTYRGRRWCAMYLNKPEVRAKMGLYDRVTQDPDKLPFYPYFEDGKDLRKILYGIPTSADSDVVGFGLIELKKGQTLTKLFGSEYSTDKVTYFIPTKVGGVTRHMIRRGDELSKTELDKIPIGTKMLYDYVDGGHLTKTRSAYSVSSEDYNDARTVYVLPDGSIKTGDKMKFSEVPDKTRMFFIRD